MKEWTRARFRVQREIKERRMSLRRLRLDGAARPLDLAKSEFDDGGRRRVFGA